jgi:hypothetical protein
MIRVSKITKLETHYSITQQQIAISHWWWNNSNIRGRTQHLPSTKNLLVEKLQLVNLAIVTSSNNNVLSVILGSKQISTLKRLYKIINNWKSIIQIAFLSVLRIKLLYLKMKKQTRLFNNLIQKSNREILLVLR